MVVRKLEPKLYPPSHRSTTNRCKQRQYPIRDYGDDGAKRRIWWRGIGQGRKQVFGGKELRMMKTKAKVGTKGRDRKLQASGRARQTWKQTNHENKLHKETMGLLPTLAKARAGADANWWERNPSHVSEKVFYRRKKSSHKGENELLRHLLFSNLYA